MYFERNLENFSVVLSTTVQVTLKKITDLKSRIVMVVDENHHLFGVVSNGDILRWLTKFKNPNLSSPISDLMNKNFTFVTGDSPLEEIKYKLQNVNYLPQINECNQLEAIISNVNPKHIKIGQTLIGPSSPCYIIAEIGINHNGSLRKAKELIKHATNCGVDAVKVQVRDLSATYNSSILKDSLKAEHGTQYILEELKKTELSFHDYTILRDFTLNLGLEFLATPFDLPSFLFLKNLNLNAYKIGSPDFTNIPLIRKVAATGKPLILSTGMSSELEIQRVISELERLNVHYALLHCNSTYPASPEDLNLNFIKKLSETSGRVVGYSGHERGYLASLASVTLGAKIIERHLTLDRTDEGPDHSSSLEPIDFKKMVQDIRQVESCLGLDKRILNQGEKVNRIALGKSLVLSRNLRQGSTLKSEDIVAKTPARGISPLEIDKIIGKRITKDLNKDHYIQFDDLTGNLVKKDDIKINKHWGIVGRLNDFTDYLEWKPKLIEIHLTWRDLVSFNSEENTVKSKSFDQDFVVHAPEYFKDKLIDFTTSDSSVLDYSFEMLQRTINLAKELAPQFSGMKNDRGPKVILHPGGHSEARLETNKTEQYSTLAKNLQEIDTDGVELLIENMPPNPWYFGGQWFNSVFLDPKEIDQFCHDTGFGMCYDTSHALLHCNYAKQTLNNFTNIISKHVRHLHISDGAGTTQEGLQLGSGNIDFDHLFEILKNIDTGFIPEIWQGHLNHGKGFRKALKTIEDLLDKKLSTPGCSSNHK